MAADIINALARIGPVIIGVVAFLFMFISSIINNKRRKKHLMEFCLRIGFQFDQNPVLSLPKTNLRSLNLDKFAKILNLIRGKRGGYHWNIFDYRLTSRRGGNRHTTVLTMFMVKLQNTSLPSFSLKTKTFFDKLDTSSEKWISFDNHPNFSKQYILKGDDKERIKEVFNSPILNFFESRKLLMTIEADNDYMLFYIGNKRTPLKDILPFIDKATAVVKLFDKETDL